MPRSGTTPVEQIRRPIYRSSIGKAGKFGADLDPLRHALDGSLAASVLMTDPQAARAV